MLAKFESQKETMGNVIVQLEKKYVSVDCFVHFVDTFLYYDFDDLICLFIRQFRYATELACLHELEETSQELSLQVVACEERASRCETDVRVEREWRCNLQEKELRAKEQIAVLQLQIKQLNEEIKSHDRMRSELDRLRKQWAEAQITLEELGIQLSVSKLQVSELQEKLKAIDQNNSRLLNSESNGSAWTPDNSATKCQKCDRDFSLTRRKVNICNCSI